MQRLAPRGLAAALSILALALAPACKGDEPSGDKPADKQPDPAAKGDDGAVAPATGGEAEPSSGGGELLDTGPIEAEATEDAGDADKGEAAAAEAAAEAGAEAGDEATADLVPGLFEQAKSLDTDDAAAKQALADAIAAGGSKIDAAKAGYARGEALMSAGESERAAAFYEWAAATHKLYADPVYKLATLAAYAGDLEIAKEHLQELQKRGNKKLMKKVGVDPAFAPLHDDPEVRKIYEQ